MSTQIAVKEKDKTEISYIPLGSEDKITLSINIIRTFLVTPTKSGSLPSNTDCMKMLALCRAQRLDPFQRDVYLAGYDGKNGPEFSIIIAHNVFLKRAVASKDYDGMESGIIYIDHDGVRQSEPGEIIPDGCTLIGGWARVHVRGRQHPSFTTLALKAFRKDNRFWNENPAGMIRKCAEKDALGQAFPNILGLCAEVANGQDVVVSVESTPILSPTAIDAPETQSATPTPQALTIQSWCEQNSITWDQWSAWARDLGHIDERCNGFGAVPDDVAKRLLRAQSGMLTQLRASIGGKS